MVILKLSSRKQVGIWQIAEENILDYRMNRKNRKYLKLKLASYLSFTIPLLQNSLPSSAYLKVVEEDR